MKVSGFTFIRNAIKYDYPIVEAILSILPICDEVVVVVGNSDDDTLNLIRGIDSKIIVVESIWDDSLREGGRVLAVETDKAFASISKDSDWAFYIQGDEVIHEKHLEEIKLSMEKNLHRDEVDGLLFDYKHFYGSYDFVGSSISWYLDEIRVIRNRKDIFSYRDAQGFRKLANEKLNVVKINAEVYHYGWVKPPDKMQSKQETFNKLWHDDNWVNENVKNTESFDYLSNIRELAVFKGTHPKVMQKRINEKNWEFDYDISFNNSKIKDNLKRFLRRYLNIDIRYKNYNKIK